MKGAVKKKAERRKKSSGRERMAHGVTHVCRLLRLDLTLRAAAVVVCGGSGGTSHHHVGGGGGDEAIRAH